MPTDLFQNPVIPRALVLGVFGGVGLILTVMFSRRGPLIFASYAAFLSALTLLLARYPDLAYATRATAGLASFLVASAALYVVTVIRANRQRRHLVATGRLPETVLRRGISLWGHTWRVGFLVGIGVVVSLGLAFVAA